MKKAVVVHPEHSIGKPNPKMWGIFYEEINHAGDGGLYAELIRNRNFADIRLPEATVYANGQVRTKQGHTEPFSCSDKLPGWYLRTTGNAIAHMDMTTENPRNAECAEQLRLSVFNTEGTIRVCNRGYWGIPVKKQLYYGYIIARAEAMTSITVGLMYSSGVVLCRKKIELTDKFEKYPFEMESAKDAPDARFFIEAEENGVLFVDFVTLFPEDTYKGRRFGFRQDLMKKLEDLHPGFIRFPGGCVVEGINLQNAIHWKKTRGPMEDRPGHWDLWGYRATDGMGMTEFCQLAEDLDADIMYVVNCGMSCQFRKSELADAQEIDKWLQNALDGIEYIYGDVSTQYGALRAADGHPEPFRLRYVEIGNENWGADYHERYRIFYNAIKKKYPELTLIATEKVPDAPMDMVDDHYYTTPQQFPTMYEAYEGDGVPVYVGEYACNTDVGYGNLLSAVSDATFMVRMENRCDRIRIASYAPLFCNDNDRRWPVNLINFDGKRVFGIPSYEVQRLFAEYTVDSVYECENTIDCGASSNLHVTAGQKGENCIIKAANFGADTIEAAFEVSGGRFSVEKAWLLSSENAEDTNSLLEPEKVKAVPMEVEPNGTATEIEFPPYSFVVMVGRVLK